MKNLKLVYSLGFALMLSMVSCVDDPLDFIDGVSQGQEVEVSAGMIQLYQVVGETIVPMEKGYSDELWMENPLKHVELWKFYKSLIPADEVKWITQFEIYDGYGEEFGYVTNLDENLNKWRLGVGIDNAYANGINGNGELAYTLIHEQAHILSLNSGQMNPAGSDCSYQTQEGCAREGSYLDEYVEEFWSDILEEHEKINQNNQNKLDRFYDKYEERFITNYAASNPVEDLAEAFTHFVKLDFPPEGTEMKFEKIRHFYNYPELILLRDQIRESGVDFSLKSNGKAKGKKCRHHSKKHTAIQA